MNIVMFQKEKQKKIKVLSKIISVLALIGKIGVCVAIPFIILIAIVLPILLSKIEVKDSSIIFNNEFKLELAEDDKGLILIHNDKETLIEEDKDKIVEFKDIIENNSKTYIIAYIEVSLLLSVAVLVLMFLTFMRLRKLFKNICKEDTPFTLENVNHIKRMSYYLTFIIVVPFIINSIFEIVTGNSLNVEFNTVNLIEILFLFSMSYIFEYGYQIQLDSKAKMYGDTNE